MASGVSVRDKLVASYDQACNPHISKDDSIAAKVSLEADIYQLLDHSDSKTRLVAESILCNKLLSLQQKLSTLRVLARSPAPHAFVPELHHLFRINQRRVREQREKPELRQISLQQIAAQKADANGRTPRSPIPSDAAIAHTGGREEKRAPSAASATRPFTALPTEPRNIEIPLRTPAAATTPRPFTACPVVPRHRQNPLHAPEAALIPRPATPSNIASDIDTDTLIRFVASLIFAAIVACQVSK